MHKLKFKSDWILVIVPMVLLICLRLLGFDGMVGQDSYAYVDYTKALVDGNLAWSHPGEFAWPSGYPLLGSLISFTGLPIPLSLQLISCLSLSGALIVVRRILFELYFDSDQQLLLSYLLLFGVLSPYYLRSSMLTTSDLLASFLVILGLYFIGKYMKRNAFQDLFLGTLVLSVAPYVRYASIVLAIPLAVMILIKWFRPGRNRMHLVIMLIPIASLLISVFYTDDFEKMLSHGATQFWNVSHYFTTDFMTNQGYSNYAFPNVIYVFYPFMHYGFSLFGLPLLIILIGSGNWRDVYYRLIIASFATYGLFLAGINGQNSRYLLPLTPFVLILCYYGFRQVMKIPFVFRFRKALGVLFLIGQITLSTLAFKFIFQRNALEQEIQKGLNAIAYGTKTLYGFDIDIGLVSRGIPFSVINLWTKPLDSFEKGALVLFNEERLSLQWKGKNPMIKWNRLRDMYHLQKVDEFSDHWKLYQIESEQ